MLKSSQINSANLLYENGNNFISKISQQGIRAIVQKQILNRLLKGEEIDDLSMEVQSLLEEKNAKFDTYIQKNEEITEITEKIEVYDAYFKRNFSNNNSIIFGNELEENEDNTILLNDKEVMPDFDYLYKTGNEIHITKIKTSAYKNPLLKQESRDEMYALSIWAKKNYPNATIYLDYDYLIEKNKKTPTMSYESMHNQHSFELTDELFIKLENSFNENIENGCNPSNCGTCGRNHLCNYEEPPMDLGLEKVIKPLSDIHLTQVQREASNFDSGISRVIAGAGAGKTLLVALRVVNLIEKYVNEQGLDPNDAAKKIAMLTYTTTGAREMTERVIRYLAGKNGLLVDPSFIKSGTINSFGQDIINDHYEELGYREPPRVIPDEVRYKIINNVLDSFAKIPEWKYKPLGQYEEAKWANKYTALEKAKNVFSDIKRNKWTLQDNGLSGSYSPQSIAMIFLMYKQYDLQMKQKCFIEFDDQLDLVLDLVEKNPTLFDEYGIEHIIMDEYQDSNLKQLNIAKAMIDANCFKSFMGVGDDSQSIFGFQNATPEFIVNFERYFGEFKDFKLIENHRSSRNIVNNANKINALVEDRVEKDLIATNQEGEPVDVQGFYSAQTEYQFMAKDIKDRIDRGEDPSSICIMAGTGDELRAIASELTKLEIPSVLMNPVPFRKNARVVALCDFYDSFVNHSPKGMLEYENCIRHGELKTASKEELDSIIEQKKMEINNTPNTIEQFLDLAKKLDENQQDICFQDFLDRLSYCRNMDELDEFFTSFELYGFNSACNKTKEGHFAGVNLITIHSAKGLEWPTTYLSLDSFDKKQYHNTPTKYQQEINEKRRLWFVGATRAKEKLICVGQYVLPGLTNKDGQMLNTFLQQAYQLQNKPYDYNPMTYVITKNEEARLKQQAKREEELADDFSNSR